MMQNNISYHFFHVRLHSLGYLLLVAVRFQMLVQVVALIEASIT